MVKQRVPYETAGIDIVDKAILSIEDFIFEPNMSKLNQLNRYLDIIAHMDILMGVEESNGYGELGRYNPEKDIVENAHIADKDGSLGVYQFLELVSYGRGLLDKSGYEMYTDMIREIGWVATDNQFLLYPGFQGNEQKTTSVSAIEKILAMVSQRMLDYGQKVKMLGKYDLEGVTIYRDTKCDSSIYLGFPEEGIRFNLIMSSGVKGSATYRASGTGNNNRDYNWIEVDKPGPSEGIEDYRNRINRELNAMIIDFFGHPADAEGKSTPDKTHPSFLLALRNAVSSEQEVMALVRNALGIETLFSKAEHRLYKSVINFTDRSNDEEFILENERAWSSYLETEEAAGYPVTIGFCINNRLIKIPNALAKAWQASLISYLSSLIRYEDAEAVKIACDDPQIAEFVAERTRGIKIEITPMPEHPTVYTKSTRTDELIMAIERAISLIRSDIPAEKIDAILRAHKHTRPRDIEKLKKVKRLSEQIVLIHEFTQEYAKKPQRMALVYNPYETGQPLLSESEDITEAAVICEDIVGALARETTTIQSFNGSVIIDGIWSYDVNIGKTANHTLTDFELEEVGRGHGRFKDLTPIFNRYIQEGARVFTKDIDAQGKISLKEINAKSSSAGINLKGLSDYDAQHLLAQTLLNYSPTGIIEVSRESQAIVVYSDSLRESPALQDIIRQSAGDTRKFFLVNKEQNISADRLLAGLNIDKDIFENYVFQQNSLTPDQLALTIAGMLRNNGIRQGRVFANTEEDLTAWSQQGLIEALVMMLKDKRFEIISDYSRQHIDYIKIHAQALIAA